MKDAYEIIGGELLVPLIGNVPHSSTYVDPGLRSAITLTDPELALELVRMTDWYTDELFTAITEIGGNAVKANHSRLVLDTERYEDDAKELMAGRGMGVIYTTTSYKTKLRDPLDAETRERYLQGIYRPYHEALERRVAGSVEKFGRCLIIDCHSFPSKPLPYEIDQRPERPEICIGTDARHTPQRLVTAAVECCRSAGVSVEIDRPFSGSMVPSGFYTDQRVSSLMIEVRRDLYLDEQTAQRSKNFAQCKMLVNHLVEGLYYSFIQKG